MLLVIHPVILAKLSDIRSFEVSPGRCHGIRAKVGSGDVCFINIHIDPKLSRTEKRQLLTSIRQATPPPAQAQSFLLGDFNFSAPGEGIQYANGEIRQMAVDGLARFFEVQFPDMIEVEQISPSHRITIESNGIRSVNALTRIDRIFTNSYTADMCDYHPHTGTIWNVCDLQAPSDHCPVFLCLRLSSPNSDPNVPSWISKHRWFPAALHHIIADVDFSEDPPTRVK